MTSCWHFASCSFFPTHTWQKCIVASGASAPVQLDTLHQVAKGQTEAWTPIETVQQQGTQEDSAGSGATGAPDIDWGVVDSQAAEIDWDAALEEGPATEDQAGIVQQGPAEFIDWDISVEDGAAGADHAPQDDELHVTTQGAPCTASVAAVRLAEDAVYRACLTDDVLELVAFLKARLAAMQRSGSEVLPLGACQVDQPKINLPGPLCVLCDPCRCT